MKHRRLLFQLAPSTPRIDETGCSLWPTPQQKDYKGSYGSPESLQEAIDRHKAKGVNKQVPLADRVMLEQKAPKMWPTPKEGDWRSGLQQRQFNTMLNVEVCRQGNISGKGGTLNPDWVEWLMGFPCGWTNLESLESQQESNTESSGLDVSETP